MSLSRLGRLFRHANANKGRIVRQLAQTSRHGFWAMADQGIVSIGNFGINIVLARAMAARDNISDYGLFALLFELMFFLNGVHAALIIYPLTVRGASLDTRAVSRLSSICMLLTFLAIPLTGGIVGVIASTQTWMIVGVWAAIALCIWQIQETTRRGLMAELRFRDAVWGDSISYLGQAASIWLLAHYNNLTLETTYQAMALTSALAALVQSMQLRVAPAAVQEIVTFAREAWTLGRWFLVGNLTALTTGFLYTANFMFWAGKEEVGVAYAINNLFRLANPLMFSIATLIIPNAARAHRLHGMRAARNVFLRFTLLGSLLLAPYLGALILFPRQCIQLVCPQRPEYLQFAYLVIVVTLSTGMIFLNSAMASFLGGIERSRLAMFGQVTYSAAFALIGMPLTAAFKFPGAVWGGFIACVLHGIVNVVNVTRVISSPSQGVRTPGEMGEFDAAAISVTIDPARAARAE